MASWRVTLAKAKGDRLDLSRLAARLGAAQAGFDFAPHFLNRIEVRGVGRQKEDLGPGLRNQGEGQLTFMRREVVHDHHIALAQGRAQDAADIGQETSASVAPSMVMQAVEPSRRIEQIMVVVCQWPWGLLAWTRSPRGAVLPLARSVFFLYVSPIFSSA
jgi:hypothetical protein